MLCSFGIYLFIYSRVYSIDPSKTIANLPEVLNFNWVVLKLTRFIYNYIISSN